jgi:hypothetical protein
MSNYWERVRKTLDLQICTTAAIVGSFLLLVFILNGVSAVLFHALVWLFLSWYAWYNHKRELTRYQQSVELLREEEDKK